MGPGSKALEVVQTQVRCQLGSQTAHGVRKILGQVVAFVEVRELM